MFVYCLFRRFFLGSFIVIIAINVWGQETWQLRNKYPTGNNLNSVIWAGDRFVAAGDGGTVLFSNDGEQWTNVNSGIEENLNGIAWNGQVFVAVGSNGAIYSSNEAMTWTKDSSGTVLELRGVTWTGTQFVAVGDSSVACLSNDGVTWKSLYAWHTVLRFDLYAVTWAESLLIAVGEGGENFKSKDGETWEQYGSNTATTGTLRSVLVNENGWLFAAGDSGRIFYVNMRSSTSLWSRDNETGWDWYGVFKADSLYLIFGEYGLISSTTSPIGGSWQQGMSGTKNTLRSMAWNGSFLVAVGDNGTILTSKDGISWFKSSSGVEKDLYGIAANGNQLVAAGNALLTSPDGLNWTCRDSSSHLPDLKAIIWTGKEFIAVGNVGNGLFKGAGGTSSDGTVWQFSPAAEEEFTCAATNGSLNVLLGNNPILLANGDTVKNPGVNGVTWDGIRFVAVGRGVNVYTSVDGTLWEKHETKGIVDALYSVTFVFSQLVAVGYEGTILTSPDIETWTRQNSGTKNTLRSIIGAVSQVVAVGDNGTILSSQDGVVWTKMNSTTNKDLYSVNCTGSKFYAVGEAGTLLESTNEKPYVRIREHCVPGKNHNGKIFMNYGNRCVSFASTGAMAGELVAIRLFDASGRCVRKFTHVACNLPFEISINDVRPGGYFLELESGGKKNIFRFVKAW